MKKNDPIDFTIPRRQSIIAILLIIIKAYKLILRQFWPLALLLVFRGGIGKKSFFLYAILAIALLTMVISIIRYFKHYFYIQNNELVVEKGVLSKKKLSIPFDRIQNVNIEQSLIHKLFNVYKISLETAGSASKELEFSALEALTAEKLSDYLLHQSHKSNRRQSAKKSFESPISSIFKLSVKDLILAGLTQNHFISLGVIFGFFFWTYENIKDLNIDIDEQELGTNVKNLGVLLNFILAIFLILLAILISLIRTVLKYYDLHLFLKTRHSFQIDSGLIRKTKTSARKSKIQIVSWSSNILQKLIGRFDLNIRQAISEGYSSKKSIKIVGCKKTHVDQFVDEVFPTYKHLDITYKKSDRRLLYRLMIIPLIIFVINIPLVILFPKTPLTYMLISLAIYLAFRSWKLFSKKKYFVNEKLILIKGGVHGDKSVIAQTYKAQSISISTSYYQRQHNLASLNIYTASGRINIPYLKVSEINDISNLILGTIENSKAKWM